MGFGLKPSLRSQISPTRGLPLSPECGIPRPSLSAHSIRGVGHLATEGEWMNCRNPRDFQRYNQRKYSADNETSEMPRIPHSFILQIFVLQKHKNGVTPGQTKGTCSPASFLTICWSQPSTQAGVLVLNQYLPDLRGSHKPIHFFCSGVYTLAWQ